MVGGSCIAYETTGGIWPFTSSKTKCTKYSERKCVKWEKNCLQNEQRCKANKTTRECVREKEYCAGEIDYCSEYKSVCEKEVTICKEYEYIKGGQFCNDPGNLGACCAECAGRHKYSSKTLEEN